MNNNIQTLLTQIKHVCKKRRVRLTPQRLAVFQLISQQHYQAISAYDLLYLVRQSSLPHAKPSTIYRSLNFLLTQGFIHRIESTNKFMLCQYFLELSHNFVFFICINCKQVTEQTIKDIEKILTNQAQSTGFTIFNKIIEAHGLCVNCINNNAHYYPQNII